MPLRIGKAEDREQEQTPKRELRIGNPEDRQWMSYQPTGTDWFKLGFSEETTFVGDAARVIGGTWEYLNQDEKGWSEILKEHDEERQKEIDEKYPWLPYHRDEYNKERFAGNASILIGDPATWLAGWAAKLHKYEKMGMMGKFVYNAAFGATDAGVRSAADGEIDPEYMAVAGLVTGGVGTTIDPVFNAIAKRMGAGSRAAQEAIDNFRGVKGQLDNREAGIIEQVLSGKEMEDLRGIIKNFDTEKSSIKKFEDFITTKIDDFKTTHPKPDATKLSNKEYKKALKEWNVSVKKYERNAKRKYVSFVADDMVQRHEAISEYFVKALEEYEKHSPVPNRVIDYTLDKFLSVATRPLFFGAMGGAAGAFMPGDTDELAFTGAVTGFMLGAFHKRIMASKLTPEVAKNIDGKVRAIYRNNIVPKLKIVSAHTLATKMKAYGGSTEKLGNMLFKDFAALKKGVPNLGGSIEQNAELTEAYWVVRLQDIINRYSGKTYDATQKEAMRILRGYATSPSKEAAALADDIRKYTDDFTKYLEQAGIEVPKKVDFYVPRIYDRKTMGAETNVVLNHLKETFKKNNPKLSDEKAMKAAQKSFKKIMGFDDDIMTKKVLSAVNNYDDWLVQRFQLPVLRHIQRDRLLDYGPEFERLMEPYINQDIYSTFNTFVVDGVRSAEFTRKMGPNAEVLHSLRGQLRNKYAGLKKDKAISQQDLSKTILPEEVTEIQVMVDAVNAYFGRYGERKTSNVLSTLATIANFAYLPTVALPSMMDLIQPLQNSNYSRSIIKAFGKTRWFEQVDVAARTLGPIENRAFIREMEANGYRSLGSSSIINELNDKFFTVNGLRKITSVARRFAFHTGMEDAFRLSREFVNTSSAGVKAKKLRRLTELGISDIDANAIGRYNSLDELLSKDADLAGKLKIVGHSAANRDAMIPNVGNRLLFTQSRNSFVRMLGMYSSWAQAKSAQVEALISRMEDGDAKLAVKIMGATILAAGGYAMQYYVKNGEFPEAWDRGDLIETVKIKFGWVMEIVK